MRALALRAHRFRELSAPPFAGPSFRAPASPPGSQRQRYSPSTSFPCAQHALPRPNHILPRCPQTLVSALEQLYNLGALDEEGLLTRLGRKVRALSCCTRSHAARSHAARTVLLAPWPPGF